MNRNNKYCLVFTFIFLAFESIFTCVVAEESVIVSVIPLSTMPERDIDLFAFRKNSTKFGGVTLTGNWRSLIDRINPDSHDSEKREFHDSDFLDVKVVIDVKYKDGAAFSKIIFAQVAGSPHSLEAIVLSPAGDGRALKKAEIQKVLDLFPRYIADEYDVWLEHILRQE